MPLTLIGLKKGMAQVFDQDGKLIVCTVILAEPNTVLQIKRKETDGYNGIQLGGNPMTKPQAARASKPIRGHFAKVQVEPCSVIHESRLDEVDQFQIGQKLDEIGRASCRERVYVLV